ncbi:hypothetical protein H0H81_005224, partial [Sphagnurus paluster]
LTTMSCRSPIEVKEMAYARIQNDIDVLKESIRVLKARHNFLSMTMLLPPEILATIFLRNADMLRDDSKMRWINVSHVCSRWRRIALETPALWSRISFNTNHNWVPTLLSRSRFTPLEFDISVSGAKEMQVCKEVLSQIHRIRDLSLRQPNSSCASLAGLVQGLIEPAPLLERLLIHRDDLYAASILDQYSHPNLFRGCAPRLRTLELQWSMLPLNLPVLSGITTLILRNINRFRPSLYQLIEALQLMKSVQTLTLRDAFTFDPHSDPNRSPLVADLSHLRSLNVRSDSISCTALLRRINYPQTANQRLAISTPNRRVYPSLNIDEALGALGGILRERQLNRLRCLSLSVDSLGYCTGLKAWGETGNHLHPPEQVPSLMVTLAHSNPERLCVLLLGLSLDNLESLHVQDIWFNPMVWRKTFGDIETLRMVHIAGPVLPFLSALQHGCAMDGLNSSGKPTRPGKLCFKALRILTSEACLDASQVWRNNIHRVCLSERRKRGVALRELYILDSLMGAATPALFDPLRTVVGKVHWDLYSGALSRVQLWTKVASLGKTSHHWTQVDSDSGSLEPSDGEYEDDEVDWEPAYPSDESDESDYDYHSYC